MSQLIVFFSPEKARALAGLPSVNQRQCPSSGFSNGEAKLQLAFFKTEAKNREGKNYGQPLSDEHVNHLIHLLLLRGNTRIKDSRSQIFSLKRKTRPHWHKALRRLNTVFTSVFDVMVTFIKFSRTVCQYAVVIMTKCSIE